MEINGKLIKTMPVVNGQSAKGTWSKQEFVIETQETYPKNACFSLWGDKTDQLSGIQVGDMVKVYFNVESREYKERWYTELRAFRIDRADAAAPSQANPMPMSAPSQTAPQPSASGAIDGGFSASSDADDLPF